MRYVADITIPDGTEIDPGTKFTKTWKIQNTGSCVWDGNYALFFVKGDQMDGTFGLVEHVVKPNEVVDISVNLTAPDLEGPYTGYWQMRSPEGVMFGEEIYVSINVPYSKPTEIPTEPADPDCTVPTDETETPEPQFSPGTGNPPVMFPIEPNKESIGDENPFHPGE